MATQAQELSILRAAVKNSKKLILRQYQIPLKHNMIMTMVVDVFTEDDIDGWYVGLEPGIYRWDISGQRFSDLRNIEVDTSAVVQFIPSWAETLDEIIAARQWLMASPRNAIEM